MPDNNYRLARIVSIEIFKLGMIEQITFRLSIERSIYFNACVTEEIFSPANRN